MSWDSVQAKKGMVHIGKGLSRSQPDVACMAREWRRPHNDLQQQHVGGGHKAIHDDATAAKIGFGAAPIHGTVHWSQFTPLLLEAFGAAWFETGSISVHFKTPVSHLQPVRAFAALPDAEKLAAGQGQQLAIWMEHLDGRVVLQGTASAGLKPGEVPTMAGTKIAGCKPVTGELLFARQPVGTSSTNVEPARIDFGGKVIGPLFPFSLEDKLACITEFHPWFDEVAGKASPWGRAVLPPECLNAIMLSLCGTTVATRWPARPQDDWLKEAAGGKTPVGLFGGCEVVMHNGPVFVGEQYEATKTLVAKGETPKTEFEWVRTVLREPGPAGRVIAEMTLQSMNLKGSFEGYEELRATSNAKAAAQSKSKL